MRWFVEVTRVGDNGPPERYCVEAKAWQAALQDTRKLRGDAGPLSKFSIELLDDGYRAVDPVQKVRYLVNQAPADAPLMASPLNGSHASSPVASPAPSVAPVAAPSPSKPRASAPPVRTTKATESVVPRPTRSRPGESKAPPPVDTKPTPVLGRGSAGSTAPAPAPTRTDDKPVSKGTLELVPDSQPKPQEAPAASSGAEGAPSSGTWTLLRRRSEEPTPAAPITYREEAYVVAPGTERDAVEALLKERLKALRSELAKSPPGQLVQLALFDHEFTEKPQRPPLGTLAWKDWRGEAVIGFPAFGEAAPPLSSSMPPPPGGATDEAPVELRAKPAAAPNSAPRGPSTPAPSAPRASRPKLVVPRRRAGEDLIAELFEIMHELHFAQDIRAGAEYLESVLDEVLPCDIVLIQVFDINTRNFVVVRARGAEGALLHATPDSDPQIVELMRQQNACVIRPNEDAESSKGRWRYVKAPVSHVLAGAVRQGGRYLGTVEIANPLGGEPFHQTEVNAMDYICAQFAEFVASRPVVVDPDVILGR